MQSTFTIERHRRAIKKWLIFFMAVLVLSGITSVAAESEVSMARRLFDDHSAIGSWLRQVHLALKATVRNYPFLFYGYDWLAFAHILLAIAFVGPYKDPIRNKWIIEFGVIACLLIIPFALIAGYFRGIPIWWRLIDCSFGIFGLIPLGICHNRIDIIEKLEKKNELLYSF